MCCNYKTRQEREEEEEDKQDKTQWNECEDVSEVELIYLVFTCMSADSYRTRLKSLSLLCYLLINTLVWFQRRKRYQTGQTDQIKQDNNYKTRQDRKVETKHDKIKPDTTRKVQTKPGEIQTKADEAISDQSIWNTEQ